jgi:hypothetical protein
METIQVINPTVAVADRAPNKYTHCLYWFSINGKLTFPAVHSCINNDDGLRYFSFWNGNKCKSIAGLPATKEWIKTHTIKQIFGDGSWSYTYCLKD